MARRSLPERIRDVLGGLRKRSAPDADGGALEADRWAAAKDLFGRALDASAHERDALLAEADRNDPELASHVRSLLSAHQDEGPLDGLQERVIAPLMEDAAPLPDLTGTRVLQYDVLERLGGGGMGVVYKAVDTRLERAVALKFLSPHLVANTEAKERFLVEARAAATMDHPNLCTIHEVGQTDEGHLFIAMTFYEGESLKHRIARGPIDVDEALSIAVQVARGLACAAGHGIVHRDIKPANLMMTPDGTVKIVDFGVAKMAGEERTMTGALLGTVSYMSPEQTRGEGVDQRADVWAVGVVLYEMLAGTKPFRGGSDQAVIYSILTDAPEPIEVAVPGLAPGVAAVVQRAIRKDPGDRYADAAGLAKDLEALLADPSSRARAPGSPAVSPDGERRLITVLSCGIGGFETMLDRVEPEVLDRELAALGGRIRGIVEDYGGVLNDFSEERAVALFGVPLTHEDDGLRAVRAGLEILETCGSDQSGSVAGLELRAAVSCEHVGVRAAQRGERQYRVGGTVVKDVSQLAASAGIGELLMFPQLARSVAPFLETEDRDPVTLSTSRAPVAPLAVLGESETTERIEAALHGELTRFVGREGELRALIGSLTDASDGSGSVVFVVGDAGVGKSRLLYEFRSHLAEEGIRYVQGRGHSYGRLTPFLPLIDCLRGIFGIGRAKPERAQELVEQRIRAIDPKLEAFIPILLHMMSIETEDRPLPDYIDDELRSASAKALLRVFTAAGKGLPLVLLLEDWHWADRGSVEVLKQLGEVVSEHSLLVVVTTRPELERSEVSPDADSLWMDLAPLDDDASTEVMRAAMHVSSVSTDLAEHVREKAGGNPFFIEELCHALVERGGVTIEQGEARVEGTLDGLAIPDTVQAVLRTRLDRLDPEAREVLRCASVVGREFGAEVLRRIVPSPSRLDRALDSLCATGLVQRVGLEPEVAYRFKHALTLDVTYNGMLERQRRERHGMVGRAIETLHADHLEEFYDRLSVHFAGGEEWETAVRYGFAAAERAAGLWRYGDAVATLERTRRWIERSGSADADERLVALLLEQERHLEKLGERDQQQRVIDEALSLIPAGPSVERANVLTRQGELATLVGRFEEAQEAFDTAIEVAAACGAADARARALRGLGLKSWRVERFAEGVELLSEVVVYDREHESPPVRVRDLLNLGRFHRELGQWDEAWECLEEAEGLAPKLLGADIGLAVNFKSLLLRAMGRSEEALEAFEEGERVNAGWLEEVAPVRVSLHSLSSAAAHLEAGHIDEALARYEHALDFARRANRFDNLAATLSSYGEALMAIGRPADAARRFEETVEIVERIGDDQMLMLPLEWLARAYEADGDERAADTWARVRGLSAPHCAVQRTLHAYEREARLREDSDRSALLGEALEFAMDLEDGATVARIRNALGIIAWKSDDLETAARHYEAAAGCLEELDDPDRETEYGVVLNGWGAVLAAQGEHERARQVLEKALAVNRQTDDRAREADSWAALGASHRRVGKWPEAHLCYERCAECRRAADDVAGEGWALLRLAEVARERAEPSTDVEAAVARALELAVAAQDPALEEQCRRMGSAEARQ